MRRPGVSGGIGVSHGPAEVSDLPREGVRRRGTGPPTRKAWLSGSGWTSWLTQAVMRPRTWAWDSCVFRKVLRFTLAVFLNRREGRGPLPWSLLMTS